MNIEHGTATYAECLSRHHTVDDAVGFDRGFGTQDINTGGIDTFATTYDVGYAQAAPYAAAPILV